MTVSRIAALAIALALGTCAASAEPTKLWEASGFQNPESALPDVASGILYVSNVAGGPGDKDGNGFISKLTLDGKVTSEKWVTGLDAPKGLALVGNKLFVADLAQLVEIDVATGTISARHQATGAKILNGISADAEGRIYVSDWPGSAIWRFADGKLEKWLETDELKDPNGLHVDGDKLFVAAWGKMSPDFSTKVPGNLLVVNLADKTIANVGDGAPVGNLDGIDPLDAENFLVSDWVAGKVFQMSRTGDVNEVLTISQGTADLNIDPASRTAYIPLMVDGKVVAYKF